MTIPVIQIKGSARILTFWQKPSSFNPLSNDNFLYLSKLKAFAYDKINLTQKLKFVLEKVENIVGKGENAGYQHFLLFPQCFQNPSFIWVVKSCDCMVKS